MKRRNQLVSTLLAGVLASGVGAATLSQTPVLVTAEETDLQENGGEEYASGEDDVYDDAVYTADDEFSDNTDNWEEQDGAASADGEAAPGGDAFQDLSDMDAGAGDPASGDIVDDAGTMGVYDDAGTADGDVAPDGAGEVIDTIADDAVQTDGGTGEDALSGAGEGVSEDGGDESAEDGAEDTEENSGVESEASTVEVEPVVEDPLDPVVLPSSEPAVLTPEDTADADALSEGEAAKAEEEARKAEEEAKQKAEIERLKSEEEADAEEEERDAEEEERRKADEERKREEEEEAVKSAEAAAGYREYYTGTYIASDVQRRLALNVGFRKIPKKFALAGDDINIYEGKGSEARVVGTLDKGGLCYIIDDDQETWVYVESGDVRGFVRHDALKTGTKVNKLVRLCREENMELATQTVDILENAAYRYSLYTTKSVTNLLTGLEGASVDRQSMIQFSMQFLGNPYVWGGESLTQGCDCSGFTMQIYRQFGIELPRCSYEQAEVGMKIPVEQALPGDLVFYARDGAVYHVLMSIGDGKAINASSSTTGIIISDINLNKACWAVRILDDGSEEVTADSSTQASEYVTTGRQAYSGDPASKQTVIEALAKASEKEWQKYGFCRSVIIAQAIQETGWGAFSTSQAGIQATDNNILGMNEDLNNGTWVSPWTGGSISRLVPQYSGGGFVYGYENMRTYEDMEACMEDYAAFKIGMHPELRGVTDVDTVISVGLKGYATDPTYQDSIRALIDEYNLAQYDEVDGISEGEVTPQEDIDELLDEIFGEPVESIPGDGVESGAETPVDETESGAEAPVDETESGVEAPVDETESGVEAPVDETESGVEAPVDETESGAEEPVAEPEYEEELFDPEDFYNEISDSEAEQPESEPDLADGDAGNDADTESDAEAVETDAPEADYADAEAAEGTESGAEPAPAAAAAFGEGVVVATGNRPAAVDTDNSANDNAESDNPGFVSADGNRPAAVRPDGDVLFMDSPNEDEVAWRPDGDDGYGYIPDTDDDPSDGTGMDFIPNENGGDIADADDAYMDDASYGDADAQGYDGTAGDYADVDGAQGADDYLMADEEPGDYNWIPYDGAEEEDPYLSADNYPDENNGGTPDVQDYADTQNVYDYQIPGEADPDTVDVYESAAQLRTARADYTEYSEEELQQIWAIVAEEDDTGYEGALAVISAAMNRADVNYGGYGSNALGQLTAPGQYSESYGTRLGGNVPDFVKQAVTDCLTGGQRNHEFKDFRYENLTGEASRIGANWYFN